MKYKKIFVCDKLPTDNCHASTILPLENGKVICAWFGGTKEGKDDVDIWYSIKDGSSFSTPIKVSKQKDVPHWNPVLFEHNDNSISLFFKVGKNIPYWKTFRVISKDEGKTFSEAAELVKGDKSGGRGPVKNKCIRLSDGRILAPASTEHTGWISFVDISDDDGYTWHKSKRVKTEYCAPILNYKNGNSRNKIPMIQPTLWEDKDGIIHMLTRTAVGKIYKSDSYDRGETWCEAYPTDLPNNNSGIDLTIVPDGRIFLVSNPISENWGERSPLTLSVSEDNGNSFKTIYTFEEEKIDSEFSYPAIVYRNNKLHISYTWERTNIAYWEIEL